MRRESKGAGLCVWRESYREVSLLVSSALEEDLRRLELNRASLEKGSLRYDYYRLIDGFWLFIILLCPLLMFEYLLICLGWIMKATYCLLKHNHTYMFTTVNLSMLCSYCENAHSCI